MADTEKAQTASAVMDAIMLGVHAGHEPMIVANGIADTPETRRALLLACIRPRGVLDEPAVNTMMADIVRARWMPNASDGFVNRLRMRTSHPRLLATLMRHSPYREEAMGFVMGLMCGSVDPDVDQQRWVKVVFDWQHGTDAKQVQGATIHPDHPSMRHMADHRRLVAGKALAAIADSQPPQASSPNAGH